jgi:hypothetical protein
MWEGWVVSRSSRSTEIVKRTWRCDFEIVRTLAPPMCAARASTQHDTATTENTEAARVTSKALNVSGNMKVDSWKSMLCKLRPTVVSTPPSLSRSIKLSNAMPETAEAEQQTRTPMQCRSASRKANQVQLSPSRKYSHLKICPCLDFGFDQSWRPER